MTLEVVRAVFLHLLWEILHNCLLLVSQLELLWWLLKVNGFEVNAFEEFVVHDLLDIGGTKAALRLQYKELFDQILSVSWNALWHIKGALDNFLESKLLVIAIEWNMTSKELVYYASKSPKIT